MFLTNNSPDLCVLTLCIKFRQNNWYLASLSRISVNSNENCNFQASTNISGNFRKFSETFRKIYNPTHPWPKIRRVSPSFFVTWSTCALFRLFWSSLRYLGLFPSIFYLSFWVKLLLLWHSSNWLTSEVRMTSIKRALSIGAVLGRQNTSPNNLPPNMAASDFLQWNATVLRVVIRV